MIRRGVVVVHGVGNQRRADQLDIVVEPLVEFLGWAHGHRNVRIVARTHRTDTETASATIHLVSPGTEQVSEEWHVREAWWAQAFRPSASATILGWAVRAFFFHLCATWRNVLLRNLGRIVGRPPRQQGVGIWTIPVAGSFYPWLDAFAWLVITLAYAILYALGLVVLIPLYVALLLPASQLWPAAVGAVQRAMVDMLTGGIGEQHATTTRHVAVAAASNAVSTALFPFIAPDALQRSGYAYDTVTVIAHSGGCVVSFDALAGEEVGRWLGAGPAGRRITWVTVGSGLNLGWRMRAKNKARDRAFWQRRVDGRANWVDIYARYDPVPQGQAPRELVAALVGESSPAYVSVRVANDDWPPSDHGAYWANAPEVMARIVDVIADSRLGTQTLGSLDGSYAEHPLRAPVEAQVSAGADHRRSVSRIQTLRLGALLLALIVLIAQRAGVERLGDLVLALLGWPWAPQNLWAWLAQHLFPAFPWLPPLMRWLVGAAAIAYAAVAVLLVVGLLLSILDWLRAERDYRA